MDLMEILKALFGDEALTFEQFAEKVNNAADVKLGNLAGGQYVEKDKYDDVSKKLETANANLEGYDPDWQNKVKQAQLDGDKKLNDYKFEQAVESAINNAGKVILMDHLNHCIVEAVEEEDYDKIKEFGDAIQKFVKQGSGNFDINVAI